MKRACMTLVGLTLLFAAAGTARAERRTHAAAKVSIDVPKGWKVETDGDLMTITDPDEDVGVFFLVLDVDAMDKALDAIDSEVAKVAKDVKWDKKPDEIKLNGMDAWALEGTGKIDGKNADLGVLLVLTPAKKILLVMGAEESAKAKKHDAEVTALLKSIQPLK